MNYPFCTIEPNVGRVGVPDPRLDVLGKIANSEKIIATQIEIADIAGLVKGASQGEGLGNQFLGHIRNVDAILHVVRCFENEDITHVSGDVNPIRDIEIVETELLLADLESLNKRYQSIERKNNPELEPEKALLKKLTACCEDGKMISRLELSDEEQKLIIPMHLLTNKPILYICNVNEEEVVSGNIFTRQVEEFAKKQNSPVVIVSAEIESEIAVIEDKNERDEYIKSLGLTESGLARVIRGGYNLLNLITFFTVGPLEAHAWTVERDSKAPAAAGVIHTDFERGFICAETISYGDYVACRGEAGAKSAGKMRLEGKEYVVQDGDVFHFRFNVQRGQKL